MGKKIRKQKTSSIVAGGFFRFALYLIVAIAVIYIGKSAYDFGYDIFYQQPVDSEEEGRDITVVVDEGDSVYQVGRTLESRGLTRDAKVFVVQEMLSNYRGKIQAGTYILNTSMTTDEMLEILARENIKGQPNQTQEDGTTQEGSSEIQSGSDAQSEDSQEGEEETGRNRRVIVDQRLVTYINSLDKGNTPFLNELEMEALKNYVPIIRRETQSLLKVLLQIKRPSRILEVGTAVGFSALLMYTYGPEDCQITTIENYEKRIPIARENFRKAGAEKQITLLEGDAQEVLKTLKEPYDFIFMDAAKGQYIRFFPEILRLLEAGGLLVSDNVLQGGDIIESHFAVERRNRTIYKRMREYLSVLKNSEELETAILPWETEWPLALRKQQEENHEG